MLQVSNLLQMVIPIQLVVKWISWLSFFYMETKFNFWPSTLYTYYLPIHPDCLALFFLEIYSISTFTRVEYCIIMCMCIWVITSLIPPFLRPCVFTIAQLLKQCTRLSVWVLYHSFGLQTLAWSKLLVLIGKFGMYILNIGSSSHHPTRVHWHDGCSQAFSVFRWSSAPVHYCEHIWEVKTGEAWKQG